MRGEPSNGTLGGDGGISGGDGGKLGALGQSSIFSAIGGSGGLQLSLIVCELNPVTPGMKQSDALTAAEEQPFASSQRTL